MPRLVDYPYDMQEEARPYHHGDLAGALIAEALTVIEGEGPASVSLRNLARRLGVSHAAPAHHFADKLALFTAIAAQGYEKLAVELEAAAPGGFLEGGLAYVRFATSHPAHVQVMYQPALYRVDDPAVQAARERAAAALYESAQRFRPGADTRRVALAGWCLMHGLSTLWLGGNLPAIGSGDPVELARWLAEATFGIDGVS